MKGFFIGLTTIDIQYFTSVFPRVNTKVKTTVPDIYVGGPAANAAIAYSFLGGNSLFFTSVGLNPFTEFICNDLKRGHVKIIDLSAGKESQPVIASVVTTQNGDRTIFTHYPQDISTSVPISQIFEDERPEFVLLDGFYPQVAEQFAREAQLRKIPVIFDGGSWKPELDTLLHYIDMAICSENFLPPDCQNEPLAIFNFLRGKGVKQSAITRGEKSIIVYQEQKQIEIPIAPIDAIDTLGAGDILHGAFCFFSTQAFNFEEAIRRASKLATATCCFKGPRDWLNQLRRKTFI